MTRATAMAIGVALAGILGGCALQRSAAEIVAEPNVGKVVTVDNAADLLRAVGSDRTIRLMPGIYRMPVEDSLLAERWLRLQAMKNLTLVGLGDIPVKILAPNGANVVTVTQCTGITLRNLEIGHDGTGDCMGDCLVITGSADITVTDCVLFGTGYNGLHAEGVQRLRLERTTINTCQRPVVLATCEDVTLLGCRLVGNRTGNVLTCYDSSAVLLRDCTIEGNMDDTIEGNTSWTFLVVPGGTVQMRGGMIVHNCSAYLLNLPEAVTFVGTLIEGNRLYRGHHANYTGR